MKMSKPFIIGIAGGSGSGKTFFLKCFLRHFSKQDVCLISQDDYYHTVGEMTDEENKLYNFDLPDTIDHAQFISDIQQLVAGRVVLKKEYTFHNKNAQPKILEIKPAPILIVEGLFILHFKPISDLLDLKIFIETDEDVALKRRLKRDLIERGYPEDAVMYKWINHVIPAYKEYLLPYKKECHKVITNNTHVADDIIRVSEEISRELQTELLMRKN